MKIKTAKNLESTSYRCLFEGIKEEGVEPFLGLFQDIHDITTRDILIRQTIFSRSNDLSTLKKNHRDIIKYFKSHKKELVRLKLTNPNLLEILSSLSNDISSIDLYLENARRLEELRVNNIQFESFFDFNNGYCGIYRNEKDEIINISKYYTDGQIESDGDEILIDASFNYSKIHFSIHDESYILRAQIDEHFYHYRDIYIKNFGFNGPLPNEEQLQSYEIPEEYTRKRMK